MVKKYSEEIQQSVTRSKSNNKKLINNSKKIEIYEKII